MSRVQIQIYLLWFFDDNMVVDNNFVVLFFLYYDVNRKWMIVVWMKEKNNKWNFLGTFQMRFCFQYLFYLYACWRECTFQCLLFVWRFSRHFFCSSEYSQPMDCNSIPRMQVSVRWVLLKTTKTTPYTYVLLRHRIYSLGSSAKSILLLFLAFNGTLVWSAACLCNSSCDNSFVLEKTGFVVSFTALTFGLVAMFVAKLGTLSNICWNKLIKSQKQWNWKMLRIEKFS